MMNLLDKVKAMLNMSFDDADVAIELYINEVIEYCLSAGCSQGVLETRGVGLIAQGVKDLYNLNSGEVGFSNYFYERLSQLTHIEESRLE